MEIKVIKKVFTTIGIFTILFAGAISTICGKDYTALFAHDAQLEVLYDFCIPEPYDNNIGDIGDGEDEKWYELIHSWIGDGNIIYQRCYHLPHSNSQVSTIKYYVNESAKDNPSLTWGSCLPSGIVDCVKTSFINSMKKWNSIYLYKYNSLGLLTKRKLINVIEGSTDDFNLIIYPKYVAFGDYASAWATWDNQSSIHYLDTLNNIDHYHCDNWEIDFNLFYHNTSQPFYDYNESNFVLYQVGAHELGHVLGLFDIDNCETINSNSSYHHEELLMGYSSGGVTTRQPDITYKDLIGAAITRGLHAADDHQWIYHSSGHGVYKLICSICNGVKYVSSLDDIDYVYYKDCGDEHDLEDGNMFAVASYGNSDYYKCKYCRYVAPFTAIEEQDYDYEEYSSTQHLVTNQVEGLEYSFYEDHTFDTTHTCTLCGAQYSHSYTHHYENYSSTLHKAYCECGAYDLTPHATSLMNSYFYNGHLYAPCMFCDALVDLGGTGPIVPGQGLNDLMVTDNGSYIMPNGIYVIIEEDLEAFLNSALIFHPYGEIGA